MGDILDLEENIVLENHNDNDNDNDNDNIVAKVLDYELNYNYKYIVNIMEYYELKKCKMNKSEMIKVIVEYENMDKNSLKVEERKRLFDNFIELKHNKFFNKFILSNLT